MMTMKAWALTTWEVQDEGSKMEEVDCGMHAELAVFGGIGDTA